MNPLDRVVTRLQRTDAMFVQESRSYALKVLLLDYLLLALAIGAWVAFTLVDGWWRTIAGVVVGLQIGRASLTSYRRAAAYRSGWLKGRNQMVAAMIEAERRGMSVNEWLEAEALRQYAVLGLTAEEVAEMHRQHRGAGLVSGLRRLITAEEGRALVRQRPFKFLVGASRGPTLRPLYLRGAWREVN